MNAALEVLELFEQSAQQAKRSNDTTTYLFARLLHNTLLASLCDREDWKEVIQSFSTDSFTRRLLDQHSKLCYLDCSSVVADHGQRCFVCAENIWKKANAQSLACSFCGLRCHAKCAEKTNILLKTNLNEGSLFICQDCSRTDPASRRLKLLRNICCIFDHLIASSQLHLFKTAYVSVLMQIVKISPADRNECSTRIVSLLSSLIVKAPRVCLAKRSDGLVRRLHLQHLYRGGRRLVHSETGLLRPVRLRELWTVLSPRSR